MGNAWQAIEYENIHSLCFNCGRIGHAQNLCPNVVNNLTTSNTSPSTSNSSHAKTTPMLTENVQNQLQSTSPTNLVEPIIEIDHAAITSPTVPTPTIDNDYGPWTLVLNKRRKPKSNDPHPKSTIGSTPFSPPSQASQQHSKPTNNHKRPKLLQQKLMMILTLRQFQRRLIPIPKLNTMITLKILTLLSHPPLTPYH